MRIDFSSQDFFSFHCLGFTFPIPASVFRCYPKLPVSFLVVACKDLLFQRRVQLVSEPATICLCLYGETYFAEMFTSAPKTISFHVVLWRSVLPIVIFHVSPAWIQVWSADCVYAAQGDAWRQTSTPHPNNWLLLCWPLLSRLIIRVVVSTAMSPPAPSSSQQSLHSHFCSFLGPSGDADLGCFEIMKHCVVVFHVILLWCLPQQCCGLRVASTVTVSAFCGFMTNELPSIRAPKKVKWRGKSMQ